MLAGIGKGSYRQLFLSSSTCLIFLLSKIWYCVLSPGSLGYCEGRTMQESWFNWCVCGEMMLLGNQITLLLSILVYIFIWYHNFQIIWLLVLADIVFGIFSFTFK